MSLVLALGTSHGIVMAADRQITTTVDNSTFPSSSTEQKLFLAPNGYGFCYTGASDFRDLPASHWMQVFLEHFARSGLSVPDLTKKLCIAFHSMEPKKNIVIIGCGYQGESPLIYSANSTGRQLSEFELGIVAYSGENKLAKPVLDTCPCNRGKYTLLDAIAFEQHVIRSVSNMQRFGQVPVTVGPVCDVLVITPQGSRWHVPPPGLSVMP